jgi:hypothetical protein
VLPDRIPSLIQSAAGRTPEETAALVQKLAGGCWPRGGDRHDPVAAQWLRRWSPASMGAEAAGCSCAAGRCSICN